MYFKHKSTHLLQNYMLSMIKINKKKLISEWKLFFKLLADILNIKKKKKCIVLFLYSSFTIYFHISSHFIHSSIFRHISSLLISGVWKLFGQITANDHYESFCTFHYCIIKLAEKQNYYEPSFQLVPFRHPKKQK